MSMLPRTACGLLEVGHSATDQEIHAAYKKLAIRFHPDKNPNISQEATEAFQLVNEAKDTLLEASRPFYQLTESPFPEERGAALKDQYERRRRLFRRRMQYGAGAGFLAHNFEGGVGSELFEKKFGSPEDGGVVSTHASPSRRGSARHAPKHGLSGEDLDDPVSPENTPTRSTSPSPRGHACVTTPRAQVFVRPGLAGEAAATSLRMGTFFGNQGHWTCRQCGEACMIVRDAAVCERCGKTLRQHTGPGHSLSGSGGYCPGFRLKVKTQTCTCGCPSSAHECVFTRGGSAGGEATNGQRATPRKGFTPRSVNGASPRTGGVDVASTIGRSPAKKPWSSFRRGSRDHATTMAREMRSRERRERRNARHAIQDGEEDAVGDAGSECDNDTPDDEFESHEEKVDEFLRRDDDELEVGGPDATSDEKRDVSGDSSAQPLSTRSGDETTSLRDRGGSTLDTPANPKLEEAEKEALSLEALSPECIAAVPPVSSEVDRRERGTAKPHPFAGFVTSSYWSGVEPAFAPSLQHGSRPLADEPADAEPVELRGPSPVFGAGTAVGISGPGRNSVADGQNSAHDSGAGPSAAAEALIGGDDELSFARVATPTADGAVGADATQAQGGREQVTSQDLETTAEGNAGVTAPSDSLALVVVPPIQMSSAGGAASRKHSGNAGQSSQGKCGEHSPAKKKTPRGEPVKRVLGTPTTAQTARGSGATANGVSTPRRNGAASTPRKSSGGGPSSIAGAPECERLHARMKADVDALAREVLAGCGPGPGKSGQSGQSPQRHVAAPVIDDALAARMASHFPASAKKAAPRQGTRTGNFPGRRNVTFGRSAESFRAAKKRPVSGQQSCEENSAQRKNVRHLRSFANATAHPRGATDNGADVRVEFTVSSPADDCEPDGVISRQTMRRRQVGACFDAEKGGVVSAASSEPSSGDDADVFVQYPRRNMASPPPKASPRTPGAG
eukprot:gene102-21_t